MKASLRRLLGRLVVALLALPLGNALLRPVLRGAKLGLKEQMHQTSARLKKNAARMSSSSSLGSSVDASASEETTKVGDFAGNVKLSAKETPFRKRPLHEAPSGPSSCHDKMDIFRALEDAGVDARECHIDDFLKRMHKSGVSESRHVLFGLFGRSEVTNIRVEARGKEPKRSKAHHYY